MKIVLDASAAIEIAMDRGKSVQLGREIENAELVLAPDLIVAEVVNAAWKYHQFENLSVSDSSQMIERALALVDQIVPSLKLYIDAFVLARTTRKPVYDMLYLALARREAAAFLTLDSALKKEAERQGVQII